MNAACREIRENILHAAFESGHGHIPTCFSVVELLHTLYETMRHDPLKPKWDERDLFILSKGHAASDFGCHADRLKIPGIEASTGSLGHGIGLAVGVALGLRMKKSDRRVFTLIGDGESNEGSVWEAVMIAVNLKLSNLTVIYDDNRSHSRGLQIKNPAGVFGAFGCKVSEIDGHNTDAIRQALETKPNGVHAIVANTVKGCGCRLLVEEHHEWHRKSPDKVQLRCFLEELHA
jgi:transketolase